MPPTARDVDNLSCAADAFTHFAPFGRIRGARSIHTLRVLVVRKEPLGETERSLDLGTILTRINARRRHVGWKHDPCLFSDGDGVPR